MEKGKVERVEKVDGVVGRNEGTTVQGGKHAHGRDVFSPSRKWKWNSEEMTGLGVVGSCL